MKPLDTAKAHHQLPIADALKSLQAPTPPSTLLTSITHDGRLVALAHMQRVCLLHINDPRAAKAIQCPGLTGGEHISALALLHWLATPRTPSCSCVLVGSTQGNLLVLSERGQLLFRQLVHDGPMRKITVNHHGSGLQPNRPQEATLVFAGALVRVLVEHVYALLPSAQDGGGTGPVVPPTLHKWLLPTKHTGPRSDGVLLGLRPPSPTSLLSNTSARQRGPSQVLMLTCGDRPPLATYKAPEQYSEYAPRFGSMVGAVMATIAAGAAETLAAGRALLPRWRAALPPEGVPTGVPSKLAHAWMEDQRVGVCLALCPRSALAALSDSQGRVLVFDVVTCVVMWMVKGYRDAQVAWASEAEGRVRLYVYAPLRAAVELWDVHRGERVDAWSLPAVPHGQRAPSRALLTAPASLAGHSGQAAASVWLLDIMNNCVFSL